MGEVDKVTTKLHSLIQSFSQCWRRMPSPAADENSERNKAPALLEQTLWRKKCLLGSSRPRRQTEPGRHQGKCGTPTRQRVRMKNVQSTKDTRNKAERQARDLKKIFITYVTNNKPVYRIFLVSRIVCKELLQVHKKKMNDLSRKTVQRYEELIHRRENPNNYQTFGHIFMAKLASLQGNANYVEIPPQSRQIGKNFKER